MRLFATILFWAAVGAAPGLAAPCPSGDPPLVLPDAVHGVRTKWDYVAGDDRRYSIQPDLAGLALADWYRKLDNVGANLADLNLDPREKLASESGVPPEDFDTYIDTLQAPEEDRGPEQDEVVSRLRSEIIPNYLYTPQQRDALLLEFLSRLEQLRAGGEISGNLRFILHQRQWFRPGPARRLVALRQRRVSDFAADMGDFINQARASCLDHWIAGIRLGENFNSDMSEFLPILVNLASSVNERTDGWLRSRLFVSNGGSMGAEYVGIGEVVEIAGAPFNFFERMSHETGSFGFAYKWMVFGDKPERHITDQMANSICENETICDPLSVADWEDYLGIQLGFGDLKDYIAEHRGRYPRHANVLFAGDSSDSLTLMVVPGPEGRLVDEPELTALRNLWPDEDGWRGEMFMNGVVEPDIAARLRGTDGPDLGMGLYFSEGGDAVLLPRSLELWQNWR